MYKSIMLLCSMAISTTGFATSLTLQQAQEFALMHSPALKAARLQTDAAEKAVLASGRWPNPKLEFETEGVGWDNDGFNDAEYSIGISQEFEPSKKREAERDVAQKSIGIAFHAEAETEQALMAHVRRAFIDVLAQQETGKVRQEQVQLGRAFIEVANRKFTAGGGSELDVVQAELAMEEILLAQTCCFGDLAASRVKLAALMGISEQELGELVGSYYELNEINALIIPERHPSLLRKDAEIDAMHARAVKAKTSDALRVKLGAGYTYDAAENANTFMFGASIPLNFARMGRALETATLIRKEALHAKQDEVRRQLQQDLSVLVSLYSGAKLEADMTRDRLIPKAEQAYALSKAGYEVGRFSWFELINAQQHLADIRVRYIESLQSAHQLQSEITRFMGDSATSAQD